MNNARTFLLSAIVTAIVVAVNPVIAATHAAKVIYAFGQVKAVDAKGAERPLRRGDGVSTGDTIATVRGRAQIKFSDGGFASLQPNTDYRIDDYFYEGKEDGNERSFLNLVKGSVRFVTGVVGRKNKKNFRIETKVATIGIRGSFGVITSCVAGSCVGREDGTYVTGFGLTSNGIDLKDGASYHCSAGCNQEAGSDERVEVEPPPIGGVELDDIQGEEQNADGSPIITPPAGVSVTDGLIGGVGFPSEGGSGNAFTGLYIVTENPPIGVLVDFALDERSPEFGADFIEFVTNDPDAMADSADMFSDPDIVALLEGFIDVMDPMDRESMLRNPVIVRPEDYHTTADDIVTMGRFAPEDTSGNGHFLDVFQSEPGSEITTRVIDLQGHQSFHFWYGPDPGPVTGMGTGYYPITDTTFSTTDDGSSIGNGVLPFDPQAMTGFLQVYFDTAQGWLDMIVDHAPMMLHAQGGIQFDAPTGAQRKFFHDNGFVTAYQPGVSSAYPVYINGAFVGAPLSAGAPPQRFGASYVINGLPSPIGGVFSGGPFTSGDISPR